MIRTFKLFALLVLMLPLAGCPLAGGVKETQPVTFEVLAHRAAVANDALVVATDGLLNARLIGSAQAQKIAAITDVVNEAITSAVAIYNNGNVPLASSTLAAAQSRITVVQGCTASSTPALQLDVCLEGAR